MLPTVNRRGFLAACAGLVAGPALLKARIATLRRRYVDPAAEWLSDGWTAGRLLRRGDVIRIAGVYVAMHPVSYRPLERLQPFIVTDDVEPGPYVPIEVIHPPLIVDGPYQNCAVDPIVWDQVWLTHRLPMAWVHRGKA